MSSFRVAAFSVLALAAGSFVGSTFAADWPQWRGPNRDDVSTETGLLKSWPEGGPTKVWMFEDCGVGYGGPSIVGGRMFVLGTRDQAEALFALDATTGEEQWAAPIGEIYHNDWGDGPRSTPTVDGEFVYVMGGQGNLVCLKAASGEVVWTKSMQDLGGKVPAWGYAESPFVYKNTVLCTPGGEKGAIAALDKATGEVVWQSTDLTSGAHYASIVAMNHDGHESCVQLLPDVLVGFNPVDGKVQWTTPWVKPVATIPTPIVRDNFAYCTCAYGAGCMLVEVAADDKATKVYDNKVMKNKHGGVILVGDALYGHSDGVGWVCQDFKTGEQLWREREALSAGAVGYADGMLYCVGEDSGDVVLVEASTEGWKEHGRFKLEPQTEIRKEKGRIWTHPVICDGRLYLRDQNFVYCFDVRDSSVAQAAGQ